MSQDVAPAGRSLNLMGRGTLSRKLVLQTSALVAVVAILLSMLTTFATYQILMRQLDDQLSSTSGRVVERRDPDADDPGPKGDPAAQQVGLLIYWPTLGTGVVLTDDGPVKLSSAVVQQLAEMPSGSAPQTVSLEGLGSYRVVARQAPSGRVTITGLPLGGVTRAMANQLLTAGLLTLGAILIAYVVARRLVQTSLRPLSRLAATATAVSALELERGEVDVPVRVPPTDADPVSEVGRVGQAFNRMLDNVEGALAARQRSETKVRQFVADASHELRNPLASIRGYAELTRRGRDELPPDTAHALVRIESEADRMSTLVEDLLLLARLDSGPALDLRPIDVGEIVVNAVSDAQAAGPGHHWSLSVPETPVVARADRHRLHQVVANLLANARAHTPAGTHVEAAVAREGDRAVIRITDDGPGIPGSIRDSVFERFTRADASRDRRAGGSSTGLGLAIVSAVVGAHGGTAEVDSNPGHTVFTIRIPAAGDQMASPTR